MLCGNYILSNRSEWTFYFLSSVQFNFTIGEFLLINSLGVIYAELHKTKEASRLFEIVNKQILSCRDAESENLNVIRYQQGCIFLKQKDYQSALKSFVVGLDRVNNLNSTFMLNNYSAKILECYQSLT